ncbi:MAG: hypothetical protein WBK28_04200 [Minisyncoccia bacterium]
MGVLEKRNESRLRRSKINSAIVATIGLAGVLALGVLAPGVAGALGKMGLVPAEKYRLRNTLGRMIQRGYVEVERKEGKRFLRLTEKGKQFASYALAGKSLSSKPKRWDGKWRVVAYDFKEPAGTLRARVREFLTNQGFILLQKSMWVYPYDCEDAVFLLKQEFKLGKGLLYMVVDDIENDGWLLKHFKLRAV